MKTLDKQARIAEAKKFFNLLFGKIPANNYSYLIKFSGGIDTPTFALGDDTQLEAMAQRAVELSDKGVDIWHAVNPVCVKPHYDFDKLKQKKIFKRGDEPVVSYQTAVVVDIDICSDAHKSDNLAQSFDEAKSFLPFTPSLIINSGYGLHAYYIWAEPLAITDDNREQIKRRNNLLLNVIRGNARGKTIDPVDDLPRILRTPGTFNYKLGKDNAPLCHIVDVNDISFTPADIDAQLLALQPAQVVTAPASPASKTQHKQQDIPTPPTPTTPPTPPARRAEDNPDLKRFRVERMLEHVYVVDGEYEKWLSVGFALFNEGFDCSLWEQWSRTQPEFKDGECESKWQGFNYSETGPTIATIYTYAAEGGYDETETRREWHQLHPKQNNLPTTRSRLKDCPVDLILPEGYQFGRSGIVYVVAPKKEGGDPKYICVTRTPIVPTKKFREPTTGKTEYEFALQVDGVWSKTEVEGRILADPKNFAATLSDKGAIIKDNKLLCAFIGDIIADNRKLPKIKSYNKTGWTDDTFTEFAYPQGDCIVRRAGFDFARTFATRGSADKWTQKFCDVLDQGGPIASLYIGTALAAVLARPLNMANPQVHLQGTSGGGKTALQKFTASIFGNPRELIRTFAATAKNRQLVADAFCDLPSFFDELETVQTKSAEDAWASEIYNYAEGLGNQANTRDGAARETFKFWGARLTTGERPILKQHDLRGAYKRLLQIDNRDSRFDDEFASDLHIFSESNFGHFGYKWINFVQEHIEEIKAKYQHYAKRDPSTAQYEPTQLKMLAAALVAIEYFKQMLGVTTSFDKATLIRNRRYLLDNNLPTLGDMDDTARAADSLTSFVASHEKFFVRETVNKPEFDNEYTQTAQVCYGKKFRNGDVAFFRTELVKILENELGFASADKLISAWYDKGCLRHNDGKKSYVMYINGRNQRMICFKAGVVATATAEARDDAEAS